MKIEDVKGTILAPPEYPDGAFLIIEVISDEELTGIGEGFAYCIHGEAAHAAKTILDMSLKKNPNR